MSYIWRVHCGQTNTAVAFHIHEAGTIAAASRHEAEHKCGTSYQRPLDAVAFYAPNAEVEVNDAHD